ncbi:hypothetical protein Vafri_7926 [Volvox africanus]|uniref:Uncharacterized protein n=1 Tax=Volvox africanus TaxID=51714 RepID=A0A8J4B145_9CHLO|nr:hypothetical protein Vafri_7926 [Volvox africanus]
MAAATTVDAATAAAAGVPGVGSEACTVTGAVTLPVPRSAVETGEAGCDSGGDGLVPAAGNDTGSGLIDFEATASAAPGAEVFKGSRTVGRNDGAGGGWGVSACIGTGEGLEAMGTTGTADTAGRGSAGSRAADGGFSAGSVIVCCCGCVDAGLRGDAPRLAPARGVPFPSPEARPAPPCCGCFPIPTPTDSSELSGVPSNACMAAPAAAGIFVTATAALPFLPPLTGPEPMCTAGIGAGSPSTLTRPPVCSRSSSALQAPGVQLVGNSPEQVAALHALT